MIDFDSNNVSNHRLQKQAVEKKSESRSNVFTSDEARTIQLWDQMVWTLDGAGDKLGEERAEEKENSRAVLDGCSFLEYIDDVSEKLETMERDSGGNGARICMKVRVSDTPIAVKACSNVPTTKFQYFRINSGDRIAAIVKTRMRFLAR